MFRLEHPWFLFGLLLVLILALVVVWVRQKQRARLEQFAPRPMWTQLMPGFDDKVLTRRTWLWLGGLSFIILSLCNPQWGVRKEKIEIRSTDIYLALDISNSMSSDDVKPSRLERSKLFVESLIRSLAGDRVGLVLFAGHSFLLSPLTSDYGSATMFVRSAHPDLITTQGTNIGDALTTCIENFPSNTEAQKVIVLISDGEDHDDQAEKIASEAKEKNVIIYSIGAGTVQGGYMPITSQDRVEYKRDEAGKPILTKLNSEILKKLATLTTGKYYSLEESNTIIASIKSEVSALTKQRIAERAYSEYESYFPYLLFPGLLLLVLEFLVSIRWFDRFKKPAL